MFNEKSFKEGKEERKEVDPNEELSDLEDPTESPDFPEEAAI